MNEINKQEKQTLNYKPLSFMKKYINFTRKENQKILEKINNMARTKSLLNIYQNDGGLLNSRDELKIFPEKKELKNRHIPEIKVFNSKYRYKKKALKINRSSDNIEDDKFKNKNMIDLMHNKEIQLCLNLIKNFPKESRKTNFNKIRDSQTNVLINQIKSFNFENINNQRIVEKKVINDVDFDPETDNKFSCSLSMAPNKFNQVKNNAEKKYLDTVLT